MSELLAQSPVIPVVAIDDADKAVDLAEALLRGGIQAIEVTLRTDDAVKAIRNIKRSCPDMIMGVGTVLTPDDVLKSVDAGADFLVSPGVSPKLEDALLRSGLLSLPGVATPSEALTRYEAGFEIVKLFPAEAVGGQNLLKSMYAPMPMLRFMPTGGVRPANMRDYYSLPNVVSVGGTWIATRDEINQSDWTDIEDRARAAMDGLAELMG